MAKASSAPCPICNRVLWEKSPAPFCSQRCADVDLGRWVTGAYVISAGVSTEDDPDSSAANPLDSDIHD
jgi:uncharacterized protein